MKISTLILVMLVLNNLVYLAQFESGQNYNPFQPNQSNNKPVLGVSHSSISKQNKLVSEAKLHYNSPDKIFNNLNKSNQTLNQSGFVPTKQVNSVNFIRSLINEDRKTNKEISYTLPKLKNQYGVEHFEKAFSEIIDMLEGKKPLSLKKAVFLVENAWFLGKGKYEIYNNQLKVARDYKNENEARRTIFK